MTSTKNRPFGISPLAAAESITEFHLIDPAEASPAWSQDFPRSLRVFDTEDSEHVLYPIHEICLNIMQHVGNRRSCMVGDRDTYALTSVENFYIAMLRLHKRNTYSGHLDTITSLYWASQGLEWEHLYYGARYFWFGEWHVRRGWEWLAADSLKIDDLTSYVLSHLEHLSVEDRSILHTSLNPQDTRCLPAPTRQASPLETLPQDILNQITGYLQVTALLRLHRCNKTFATRIPLDQCFWREAIISCDLVPFLWDMNTAECRRRDVDEDEDSRIPRWNWKLLAKTLKEEKFVELALNKSIEATDWQNQAMRIRDGLEVPYTQNLSAKMRDAPLGLSNRCRIVRIVEDIERLDRSEAEHPSFPA
ncbi:MAG: hypothetical protein M1827_007165 [Pycnora praestabilis]|nr:MAG: hypothetical protein M1827_007165 [Pycnora praestabilis]